MLFPQRHIPRAPAADYFLGPPGDTKIHPKCIKTQVGSQVCESVASKWPRGAKCTPRCSKSCQKGTNNTPRGTPGMPFWHLGLQMCTFAKHQYLLCKTHICTPGGLLLGTPATHSDVHGALPAKMRIKEEPRVLSQAPGVATLAPRVPKGTQTGDRE